MYADDVPKIAIHAAQSAEHMADVVTFVIVSIREPFGRMRNHMRDVRQRGELSGVLWGHKAQAYAFLCEHKARLYGTWRAMCAAGKATAESVTLLFTEIPGIGIVKSAFIAQMLGYNVACFDTRNMQALGFAPSDRPWRTDGAQWTRLKPASKEHKVRSYVRATLQSGGAAHWWDAWCNGIAPSLFLSGNDVSAAHRQIITGR